MAISSLAYKITADTRQFTKNVSATRRELTLAKRVMQETEEPADRLEASLTALEQIHKKGLISAEQYAKAQDKVRREITGVTTAAEKNESKVGRMVSKFSSIGTTLKSISGPILAATASFGGLSAIISEITQQLDQIDQLAKTSAKLGVDPNDLRALQVFAGRRGASEQQINTGLQRLVRKVGLAQLKPGGEDSKTFGLLGLDAQQLSGLDVPQQFIAVQRAIAALPEPQQLGAIVKVFDSEGAILRNSLDITTENFRKVREDLNKFAGEITPGKIEQLNDDRETLGFFKEGFFGGLAEQVAGRGGGAVRLAADRGVGFSGRDLADFFARGVEQSVGRQFGTSGTAIVTALQAIERNTAREPIEVTESGL